MICLHKKNICQRLYHNKYIYQYKKYTFYLSKVRIFVIYINLFIIKDEFIFLE